MTQSPTFSHSFSLGKKDLSGQSTDLFTVDELSETAIPGGSVLARNRRTGKQMVLPAEVLNAISYCTEFRSLDDHISVLMEDGPADPGRAAAIRSVIQSVQAGGLTLSARDICDRLAAPDSFSGNGGQPVMAVITWERPLALQRLLDSFLSNCDQLGIDKCVVVDDSRSVQSMRENRKITAGANDRSAIPIEYFGAEEAHNLVNQLIRQLPRHEDEIRFLLDRDAWKDHWTAGIARNYCQLLSVGKRLIVCDDDVICDVYEAPFSKSGLEFSERSREAVHYPDRQSWPEPAVEGKRDPLHRHMQFLGLTIPQTLSVLGMGKPPQSALKTTQAKFAGRLSANSRVLITECGSLGDPGTGNNRWLATLPADSRQRLMQDDQLLQSALRDRNCWSGRMCPVFTPRANMSQITGSDNRGFLPPYLPVIRGQDRIFGEVCKFLFPDSVTLDLPWAAPHLPLPGRTWGDKDNSFSRSANFPGGLMLPPGRLHDTTLSRDSRLRLEILATYYQELAACPEQELFEAFAGDWHQSWSAELSALQAAIDGSADAPPAWRNYLQNAYQKNRASNLENATIAELHSPDFDLSGPELVSFWRSAWSRLGRSMLAWESIRETARQIVGSE